MTESSRELFNQVLTEINVARVGHEMKDQMKDLVFHVMKFNNGTSNEVTDIKDSLTLLTIFIIRHNLRSTSKSDREAEVLNSKLAQIIYLIRPIAWPIAVVVSIALFSPNFPAVLRAIKEIW